MLFGTCCCGWHCHVGMLNASCSQRQHNTLHVQKRKRPPPLLTTSHFQYSLLPAPNPQWFGAQRMTGTHLCSLHPARAAAVYTGRAKATQVGCNTAQHAQHGLQCYTAPNEHPNTQRPLCSRRLVAKLAADSQGALPLPQKVYVVLQVHHSQCTQIHRWSRRDPGKRQSESGLLGSIRGWRATGIGLRDLAKA